LGKLGTKSTIANCRRLSIAFPANAAAAANAAIKTSFVTDDDIAHTTHFLFGANSQSQIAKS